MERRFDYEGWKRDMKSAIESRNAQLASELMYQNDRNGCFSFRAVCREFGRMKRQEWIDSTLECAQSMLETAIAENG